MKLIKKVMLRINSNYPSKRGLISYFFDTQYSGKTTITSRIITILSNIVNSPFYSTLPPLPHQFLSKKKGRGLNHLPCAKFRVSHARIEFTMLLKDNYIKSLDKNKYKVGGKNGIN